MRYTIQQQDLEPEESLSLFRRLVRWAASRSDRFLLSMYLPHYDDPDQVERIRHLGTVIDDQAFRALRGIISPPSSPADRLVRVVGVPDENFVEMMTSHVAPPGANAGDDSPVEDIWLYAGGRTLYILEDYGRDHIIDVDDLDSETELLDILASFRLGRDSLYPHVR